MAGAYVVPWERFRASMVADIRRGAFFSTPAAVVEGKKLVKTTAIGTRMHPCTHSLHTCAACIH